MAPGFRYVVLLLFVRLFVQAHKIPFLFLVK